MSRIVQTRQFRPWIQPKLLFELSSYGAEQRKNLKILHGFTDSVRYLPLLSCVQPLRIYNFL